MILTITVENSTLIAAYLAAFAAAASAGITYLIYASRTLPDVIVFAAEDPEKPYLIMIVIRNIGNGVARNVRFQSSREIRLRAFVGYDAKKMTNGPLIDGIPFLPPGGERRMVWGFYEGIHALIGDFDVTIRCIFEAKHALLGVPYRIERDSTLEVRSFAAGDIGDRTQLKSLVDEVRKLSNRVEALSVITEKGLNALADRADRVSDNIRKLR